MKLSKKLSMAACTMALTAMTTAAMAAPAAVPMEKLYNIDTEGENVAQATISFTVKDIKDAAAPTGTEQGTFSIVTKDGQELLSTLEDDNVIDFTELIKLNTLTEKQQDALKKSSLQMKIIQSETNENGDTMAKIACIPAAEVVPAVSINH